MFQVCDEEGPNDKLLFGFLVYFFSFFLFISNYLLLVLGICISDKGSRKGREEQGMTAKTATTPLALPYQPAMFQVCDEEGSNDELSFGFLVYFFSFFLTIFYWF